MQHIFSFQICNKNRHTDTSLDPEKEGGEYPYGNKETKWK